MSNTFVVGIAGKGEKRAWIHRHCNMLVPVEDGNPADGLGISAQKRHNAPKNAYSTSVIEVTPFWSYLRLNSRLVANFPVASATNWCRQIPELTTATRVRRHAKPTALNNVVVA